jgi:dTMP kinase
MFITFEGIDGSGKSTQILQTAKWLRAHDCDVLVSREPGGTELGEAIRAILLDPHWHAMTGRTEFLLMSASRAQLVDELVRPHLTKPRAVVILDRYDDSSTAYQGGGRELGTARIEEVNRFVTGSLEPDLTFVLDLDWETSCRRRAAAGMENDRFESNAHEFFERVRAAYHELAVRHPRRIVLLDGAQSPEIVFQQICAALQPRLSQSAESGA